MWYAVFKTMFLRLVRDRGALILAFVLPGCIFAIFAAIFANASGGKLDVSVAVGMSQTDDTGRALIETLSGRAGIDLGLHQNATLADIQNTVRLGQYDAGLFISGAMDNGKTSPITIIEEGSRKIAASVLEGELRQVLSDNFASVLSARQMSVLTPLMTDADREKLQAANAAMTAKPASDIITRTPSSTGHPAGESAVAYYVGATLMLFVLFSAMQGASLSLQERTNGISDRLLLGPTGALTNLMGKYTFLTLQGTVQALVIFAVAWLAFGIDIWANPGALLLMAFASASAAAGLALLTASLCTSAIQMHTLSTFLVLIFSAIGGSMVPRFMMPDWLKSAGWLTPNGWSINGFYGILARGQSLMDSLYPICILIGIAVISTLAAAVISHRMMRI